MASLFRNTRSLITRFTYVNRTATTAAATASATGTQPKTSGTSTKLSGPPPPSSGSNMAVRDARQRLTSADAIRPRPAGDRAYIPLVGKSLNTWGQMACGLFLAISAYFVYINYIINPEFYKSLKLSREAGKRGSHEQPANREGTIGQKIDDAAQPKGALNKHL